MEIEDRGPKVKKVNFIGVLLALIAVAAGSALGTWAINGFKSDEAVFDAALVEAANEINSICPMQVDEITRLDNVISGPGRMMTYNYTLINIEESQIDKKALEEGMEKQLISMISSDPDMKSLYDEGVIFVYKYRDMNGTFIMLIEINPADVKID